MVAAYFHLLLQKEYIAAFLCERNANFTQEQTNLGVCFLWLCYERICNVVSGVSGKDLVTLYSLKQRA